MKPDYAGLFGFFWLVALGVALLISAAGAYSKSLHVEEHAWGCDAFGYLRMAQEVRRAAARGEWPSYHLETPQNRLLIEHMKARGGSPKNWGEMVAPHAHHYFPGSDQVAVQYPPGTGLSLALFPQGEAIHGLCRAVIVVFVLIGVLSLIASVALRAWAAAGGVIFALQFGLDMLGGLGAISYSINAVLTPLLIAFTLLFLALILRTAAGYSRASVLTAVLAGVAFGFAVLVRLPILFLLPGAALLLVGTTRRSFINSTLIAFALGCGLGGALPLALHQQQVTGSWHRSTYGSDDNSPPTLDVLEKNFEFYFRNGPGAQHNWGVDIALVGFLALVVATRMNSATHHPAVGATRILLAAGAIGGISTAYFLTHRIAIPYYQYPAIFSVVVVLALGGLSRQVRWPGTQVGEVIPCCAPKRIARGLAMVVAFLPGVAALDAAWPSRPRVPLSERVHARQLEFPGELTNPRSWVFADLLTGPLWYYAGKPAYKITFTDAKTRALAYRFVFDRGEPQYVVRDCDAMQGVIAEIERMGGVLEQKGIVDNNPYFLVRWPATGPRSDDSPAQ